MIKCPSSFLRRLLLGVTLAGTAMAQTPRFLPAEIPLELEVIYQQLEPAADYGSITQDIIRQLERNHYEEFVLDDDVSSATLDRYLEMLDPQRIYFTAADVAEFEEYRFELDDMLLAGDVSAGYHIYNRYQQRLIERLLYSIKRVEEDPREFDFTRNESIMVDRKEAPWAADDEALRDLWRKRVKSALLSQRLNKKDLVPAADAAEDAPAADPRETLAKRYRSQLSQVLKTNGLDVFQGYMDALTTTFDPHTQYYAPRAAENFNMNMRLSLEGIGAVLKVEDEYTEVVSIVTGGPADKQGQLHPADRIVGVAQDEAEFVDVIGWRIDDVVQLIRGEKGSTVRLQVIPAKAKSELETQVISITRDTVKLEDQSAKKEIVEVERDGQTFRLGVIELPTFYIDFEALQRRDPDYRSSTRDVRRLLEELKEEQVDGVVVDLRRNGGGSLSEANALVGLFIERGPTVQVRDADGNVIVQGDPDKDIVYDGPLAVLVNRLSASASEIFAGAIQDYQRGLVLGSQTFGKGTVQELVPMDQGQMKITRAKFYRISGESTQHKGVTPDIPFPDLLDSVDNIGESALPNALPWDTIDPRYYRPLADLGALVPVLRNLHAQRLESDPDFVYIRAQIERALADKDRNELTLNEAKLRARNAETDRWRLELENTRRAAKGMPLLETIEQLDEEEDVADLASDNGTELEEGEDAEEDADPYLVESGYILADLVHLQSSGKMSMASQ